jgi:hypothetical protein
MAGLTFSNITYQFNPEDSFTGKNGVLYEFISIKKITDWNGRKKFQTITIKHEHWKEFRAWLLNEINFQYKGLDDGDNIPDEETSLEPF